MSKLWKQLHQLFDTNDGSLPSIGLNNLKTQEVERIYLYLRSQSELVSIGSYFWSTVTDEEVPIDSVENAAHLVIIGEAENFHLVVSGLTFGDAVIPDLGIFVFTNSIELDYRMGEEWGIAELDALFMLFSKIRELAPLVKIDLPDFYAEDNEQFTSALMEYWNIDNY
jgi:hypothetical protein